MECFFQFAEAVQNFAMQKLGFFVATTALIWFLIGLLLGRKTSALRRTSAGAGKEKSKPVGKGRSSSELYVGNLPYEMTESQLRKVFGRFGKVLSVRIIVNMSSGSSKGYGFVDMQDRDQAREAMKALNSEKMDGRRIVVSEARNRGRRRG